MSVLEEINRRMYRREIGEEGSNLGGGHSRVSEEMTVALVPGN